MARKRRRRRSRRIARDQIPLDPDVPTYDCLEHINLDDTGDVDQALDNLINDIKTGYFLQWEAVVRQEQGLPLTRKQKRILTSLISFGAEEDDRILYIDEIPRPKEPWYEIAKKIAPLDIFPAGLQHRLWLQTCFDALAGLGQGEALTLENERQQDRIKWFIDLLKEHKDTVQYLDLTLETLLTRVIMPPKDEKIFFAMMTQELGLASPQDRLADFL
jgi:hypothetical protein